MYSTLFFFLVLGGLGLPVPEELPLILAGMAVAKGTIEAEAAFLFCYFGVLIGDQIMYLFGYLFGRRLLVVGTRSKFFPRITEQKVREVRAGFRKHRLPFLFVSRHLFFLRGATFVIAGSLHLPYVEFLTTDALAAFFSVTFFIWLGYKVGGTLSPEVLTEIVHQANVILFAVLVLGIASYWFYFQRRKTAVLRTEAEQRLTLAEEEAEADLSVSAGEQKR